MSKNPFNPAFDYNKTSFISDNLVLNNLEAALTNDNSKWRTTFILGMRGAGKTSLLTYLSRQLMKCQNTVVLSLTATEDLLGNIVAGLQYNLSQFPEFKGLTVGVPGIGFNLANQTTRSTFQYDVEKLLKVAKKMNVTIVLLLEEVQNQKSQLRTLFTAHKAYIGAELPIIIVSAGLPSAVDSLINDDALTFLLRANRIDLGPLEKPSITKKYIKLFKGRGLSAQQAVMMAEATMGYPYMYQLLGDYLWENGSNPIQSSEIDDAVFVAKAALYQNVYSKVVSDLAPKERELLLAIQANGGQNVSTEMLKATTQWNANNLTTYKAVLNHWGITKKTGYGLISFVLPYFSDFLYEYFD